MCFRRAPQVRIPGRRSSSTCGQAACRNGWVRCHEALGARRGGGVSNAGGSGSPEIVLVHNHPSGDPSPSPHDVSVTQGLEFVGQLLQIPVVDHVIVGDPGIASLREMGLLEFDPGDPGLAETPPFSCWMLWAAAMSRAARASPAGSRNCGCATRRRDEMWLLRQVFNGLAGPATGAFEVVIQDAGRDLFWRFPPAFTELCSGWAAMLREASVSS